MKPEYLECGKITSTHGVHGACKAESWCDSTSVLCGLKTVYIKNKDEFSPLSVIGAFPHKGMAVLTFYGIDTPEKAFALKDTIIYAARRDIPVTDGALLLADMIGLPVIDADSGKVYGKLSDIDFLPASPVYTVELAGGGVALLPAVKEFVCRIEADKGIFVKPIPGLLDGDAEE